MNEVLESKMIYLCEIDHKLHYLFLSNYGRSGTLYDRKRKSKYKFFRRIEMERYTLPTIEVWCELIKKELDAQLISINECAPALIDEFFKRMEMRKYTFLRACKASGYGLELIGCLLFAGLLWYLPWALRQGFLLSFLIALAALIVIPVILFLFGFLIIKYTKKISSRSSYHVLYGTREEMQQDLYEVFKDTFHIDLDNDDFDD